MPRKPPSQIRCFYYDSDGTPIIKGGCRKRNNGRKCDFCHPDDPGWDYAEDSMYKDSVKNQDSDRYGRRDGGNWGRNRRRSPSRSRERDRSRWAGSSRDRGSSGQPPNMRGRRSRTPTAPRMLRSSPFGPPPPPTPSAAAATAPPPHPATAPPPGAESLAPSAPPPPPTAPPPATETPAPPPPPAEDAPAVIEPSDPDVPPLPAVPQPIKDEHSQDELMSEQRKQRWSTHIQNLTKVTKANADFTRAKKELQALSDTKSKPYYALMSEADKVLVESDIEALTKKFEETKIRVRSLVDDTEADLWPLKEDNLTRHVEKLSEKADDIVDGFKSYLGKGKETTQESASAADAMDVDREAPEGPDLTAFFAELDDQVDRVEGLEKDLQTANDDVNALRSEFIEHIDEFIREQEEKGDDDEPERVSPEELDPVKERVTELEGEVAFISNELVELIKQTSGTTQELVAGREEQAQLTKDIQLMRAELETSATEKEQIVQKVDSLTAAIQAYNSPPQRPVFNTSDQAILNIVRGPIAEEVRLKMQPIAEGLRATIQSMLDEHGEEIKRVLGSRLGRVQKTVEIISEKVSHYSGANEA